MSQPLNNYLGYSLRKFGVKLSPYIFAGVPAQVGNSGKFLTTTGTSTFWSTILADSLPNQVGNSGKFLQTNGSITSWASATTIYTGDGSLSGDRVIDQDGHFMRWILGNNLFEILNIDNGHGCLVVDATPNAERAYIQSTNDTGDRNLSIVITETNATEAITNLRSDFQDNTADAQINMRASVSGATIEYTADTHTFNGDALTFNDGTNDWFSISTGAEAIFLGATNTTGGGNQAYMNNLTSTLDAFTYLSASFNGVAKEASISLTANVTDTTIEYTAAHHLFVGTHVNISSLQEFANNAAAVTGGLVAGDLYYTTSGGKSSVQIVV